MASMTAALIGTPCLAAPHTPDARRASRALYAGGGGVSPPERARRSVPVLHHQLERDHPSRREVDAHRTRLPDALHEPALRERALALVLHGRGQAKRAVEEGRVGVEDDLVETDGRDRKAEAI